MGKTLAEMKAQLTPERRRAVEKRTAEIRIKVARLAMLRRLYHHVIHGGTTTSMDEVRVGEPVTKENLARLIREAEYETRD